MTTARLIVDIPARNADLLYATRFTAPDPCIFIEIGRRKILLLSTLECDRGRRTASVDAVLPLADYSRSTGTGGAAGKPVDAIDRLFRERRVRRVVVPDTLPVALADELRRRRYRVEIGPRPFYPARLIKTIAEQRAIDAAQRAIFRGFRLARTILAASRIRRGLLWYQGKILTAERLREAITVQFVREGFATPDGSIVAGGDQAIDPHEWGHGPLKPYQAIVVDLFPRSMTSHYFGDGTRTFCRGAAPPALKRLYATVAAAQAIAIRTIRAGVNGRTVHAAVVKFFAANGYLTGPRDGRQQGFFHGTGHGVGLEIHEPPRVSTADAVLKAGYVVSVEPALYYKGIGGVRIEDLVCVTKTGCRILGGHFPRHLEIL